MAQRLGTSTSHQTLVVSDLELSYIHLLEKNKYSGMKFESKGKNR